MDRRLTSNDIAKIAGVSQTTVSLVLRGKSEGRVSEAVTRRVLQIAEQYNYRVNNAASVLKSGRSKNIALIVPDSENPFYSHILHHLRKSATDKDAFCLLLETNNEPNWYSYIENAILSNEIDIAVVCYTALPKSNPAVDERLIFINDMPSQLNSIFLDFPSCIKKAVGLFRERGYKQAIHGRTNFIKETFTNRQAAYYEACSEYKYLPAEIVNEGLTYNNMEANLENFAGALTLPAAFILDDDLLAPGVYQFAMKHGCTIGKDIGIIGIDDIFICNNFFPKLSSFGYDIDDLIDSIWRMREHIHNKEEAEHYTISLSLNDGASY